VSEAFKDHFSSGSDNYSAHRPDYPEALFTHLASIAPATNRVWDCATGNGQAAVALANHFDEIMATDASEKQISNAAHAANITYRVAPAEKSGIQDESVDLITVAQALHWFDIDAFAQEAARVLRPNGVLSAWTYALHNITPEIDACVREFYTNVVGNYWPPERRMVENGYKDINMPFPRLESPAFEMTLNWNLSQLLGYLDTWSAVTAFKKKHGTNPLETISDPLHDAWSDPESTKRVIWPLTVKLWVI